MLRGTQRLRCVYAVSEPLSDLEGLFRISAILSLRTKILPSIEPRLIGILFLIPATDASKVCSFLMRSFDLTTFLDIVSVAIFLLGAEIDSEAGTQNTTVTTVAIVICRPLIWALNAKGFDKPINTKKNTAAIAPVAIAVESVSLKVESP